ncbi:MAG TPA: GerMN domain-containing protein [Candidatus Ruminococcus gallistercoris]|nr:GerMN domain-containing protein [Candidatus Ruminococcus gallistercoris]
MTGQTKKNKPNRRAAALCLALLLCVSAAGCSAGETPSAEGAAPAAAEAAPEAAPETTPEAPAPAEAEAEAEPDSATAAEPAAGSTVAAVAAQDVPVFVPNDSGLTQYTLQGETTDAAALVEKMAEKGAFPADVVLEALDESDGVVRLQFSGALQSYIDGASSAAALEAISKTFRAFYEAGGRPIETLEIYAAGEPVTVGGVAVDCTVLMYGELPVSGVVEEP